MHKKSTWVLYRYKIKSENPLKYQKFIFMLKSKRYQKIKEKPVIKNSFFITI